MAKKRRRFEIPDPANKLENAINLLSKYKIGEQGIPFYSVKNLKPIFAFDYMSLDNTDLCFNAESNNRADLLGFLKGLKKVSSFTYEQMRLTKALRFHSIDLFDKNVSLRPTDFLKVLAPSYRGMSEDELPTLYQFDLQFKIEARAVGFLYKGVFYVVWYDRNHIIYPKG